MDIFEGFSKIKYYIILMASLFGLYVWAGVSGTRIFGDDNIAGEERSGNQRSHGFYHK